MDGPGLHGGRRDIFCGQCFMGTMGIVDAGLFLDRHGELAYGMTSIRALAKAATAWKEFGGSDDSASIREFHAFMSPERALAMQDVIDLAKELAESGLASDELRAALARLEAIR